MSNEIPALAIDEILGSLASDDGKHALIQAKTGGNEITLAVPEEQLVRLISTASAAAGQCRKILHQNKTEKQVFSIERWEFGLTPDGGGVVLSFQLHGGAEMSFHVHMDRLPRMREALERIEELASLEMPPGTLPQ
jgi:hypothetical protein